MASSRLRAPPAGRDEGILARAANSSIVQRSKKAAAGAGSVAKKLLWSTGRAAWIAGTSFLILALPLIIEMDREQQLTEYEQQQATILGAPLAGPPPPSPSK